MIHSNLLKTAGTYAAASLMILAASCSKGNQGQMQQQAPSLEVITVTPGASESESTFPAQIKGKTDIAIRPQVSGFITKVHVDEGQHVRKGQVLFTLDQVTFQAAVDQARAAVNASATAVATAQRTVDTKKQLLDKNIISDFEYQTAVDQLAQAKASLAQANSGLVSAKKNLAYTIVTSPSDGVVGTIPQREGSLASPSSAQPLTTVSDNSQVYAYFSLTERDLLNLAQGGEQTVNGAIKSMPEVSLRLADGSMYPLQGKVATVSGVIDTSTGAATVRALFDNTNGLLRSGSTGTIVFPENKTDVIVIPQKATYELQDRRFVYVVNDSNKLVATPVEVTAVSDGQTFVVNEGLQPGQRIVVEGVGTQSVRPGMAITPVTKEQAAQAQPDATQPQAAESQK
ncbi:MAG: efflux RND transporter periplasmic adaptor subunit [Pseudoflavonifractor sp.]|nr:efflux RND transporter periplasmic adaptor subunit [Alloprevotella sp.]MCM1116005.1 efflux RND transporter periplasmic adaptor subunit [Pseudoflavonifractor sp.]